MQGESVESSARQMIMPLASSRETCILLVAMVVMEPEFVPLMSRGEKG